MSTGCSLGLELWLFERFERDGKQNSYADDLLTPASRLPELSEHETGLRNLDKRGRVKGLEFVDSAIFLYLHAKDQVDREDSKRSMSYWKDG